MSCIMTNSHIMIDPLNPDPELIQITDIAHALSLTCRGNGHVKNFFSVGQHCINAAKEAAARGYSKRIILASLLHDASEAYMSDVPRPLKRLLPEYVTAEDRFLDLIYEKFLGSSLTEEEAAVVKRIDNDLLYFDLKFLLNETLDVPEPTLHISLNYEFIPFEQVEQTFMELFKHCM